MLCGRGVDAVGPRRDKRVFRGNSYLEGKHGAGTEIGWGLREYGGELSQDIAQLGDGGRRPTETM